MKHVLKIDSRVDLFEMNCDSTRMDFQMGLATFKMCSILDAIFHRIGVLPDVPFHLQGWLEEAGFVNVHMERHRIPMCGEEGKDMLQDAHTVHKSSKAPAPSKAGGFGFVESKEEYDELVIATYKELVNTDDAAVLNFMI